MNTIKFEKNEIGSIEQEIANKTLTFTGYNPDGSWNYSDLGIANLTALYNARVARAITRMKMDNESFGSPDWREAEQTLNFWQSKVAMLEADKEIRIYQGR